MRRGRSPRPSRSADWSAGLASLAVGSAAGRGVGRGAGRDSADPLTPSSAARSSQEPVCGGGGNFGRCGGFARCAGGCCGRGAAGREGSLAGAAPSDSASEAQGSWESWSDMMRVPCVGVQGGDGRQPSGDAPSMRRIHESPGLRQVPQRSRPDHPMFRGGPAGWSDRRQVTASAARRRTPGSSSRCRPPRRAVDTGSPVPAASGRLGTRRDSGPRSRRRARSWR